MADIVRSTPAYPRKLKLTDLPTDVVLHLARFCSPNDHVCLALANKDLACALLPLYEAPPQGGISITVKWSVTTSLFLRQALLTRIRCHHSSPSVAQCWHCQKLLTTERTYWEKELARVKANGKYAQVANQVMPSAHDREMEVVELERVFGFMLLAWHGQTGPIPGDPHVYCPGCAAVLYTKFMKDMNERKMVAEQQSALPIETTRRPLSRLH